MSTRAKRESFTDEIIRLAGLSASGNTAGYFTRTQQLELLAFIHKAKENEKQLEKLKKDLTNSNI